MSENRFFGRRALGVAFVVLGSLTCLATPAFGQSQYKFALSSGLFLMPPKTASVDWAVVNNDLTMQKFTVTVYRHGVGVPRVAVVPGPLQFALNPTEATHNANSAGPGQPFEPGFYYEVILETDSPYVLPSVTAWPGHFGEAIPGTLIPPGSWVRVP
jgi:hypothetical protein